MDTWWVGHGWIQGVHGYMVGRTRVDTGWVQLFVLLTSLMC